MKKRNREEGDTPPARRAPRMDESGLEEGELRDSSVGEEELEQEEKQGERFRLAAIGSVREL